MTSFTQTPSGYWLTPGHTEEAVLRGQCYPNRPGCQYANDVFFDDRPLCRVLSLIALRPGCFYFDYQNDTIYLADDPFGHRVELSVVGIAFRAWGMPGGTHAVIRGLVIEKFAGNAINANDWLIEDNEVRLNHGIGIASSSGVVRRNFVHDNGQLGVASTGLTRSRLMYEENEIAYNNYAGYHGAWQAGGGKWTTSSDVILRNNYIHDNRGPGIWFDYDNKDILIEKNHVANNAREGILIEASFDALVRGNRVEQNGFEDRPPLTLGAGILNASSARVEVYGNIVKNNYNGISATERGRGIGPYGAREVTGYYVHDNVIRMLTGYSGLVAFGGSHFYRSEGNRFRRNRYIVGCQKPFVWYAPKSRNGYDAFTIGQWKASGQDVTGRFRSTCDHPPGGVIRAQGPGRGPVRHHRTADPEDGWIRGR